MDIKSVLVDKWDRIMVSYTIILAFLFVILKFYSLEIDYMMPLALLVLTPIPWAIGKVQHQTEKLESSTIELRKLINQPDINKVLKPFNDYRKEIKEKISGSDRICLLSRTGQKWWEEYLIGNIENKEVRLLVLDPRDGKDSAFKMHFTSDQQINMNISEKEKDMSISEEDKKVSLYHKIIDTERGRSIQFLNEMVEIEKIQKNVHPKVLNYLPAWSILILENSKKKNAGNDGSIIYCELAPYKLTPYNRPMLKVTEDHNKCFKFFRNEFESLWKRAEDYP